MSLVSSSVVSIVRGVISRGIRGIYLFIYYLFRQKSGPPLPQCVHHKVTPMSIVCVFLSPKHAQIYSIKSVTYTSSSLATQKKKD